MRIYDGSPRQDWEDVLRAIGAFADRERLKEILLLETSTPTLSYTPDAREAIAAVRKGAATCAVLLNPPKVEQVFAVADAGDVMPQKSTYFIPKVPSGLVLLRIDEATEGRKEASVLPSQL